VAGVIHGQADKIDDMLVIKGVPDEPAIATIPDQSGIAKEAEMVGDGRFAQPDRGADIADTELGRLKRAEYAEPIRIRDQGEEVGYPIQDFRIESGCPRGAD
jgi:hypothetical protein